MYGNTHLAAERVADGMRTAAEVTVVPVCDASVVLIEDADLLVVGGPTHVHGMASDRSRAAAAAAATKPGSVLELDESAQGIGLRKWLEDLPPGRGRAAAAFDTRMTGSALVTGRASRSIAKQLSRHGFDVIADSASFLVDHDNRLLDEAPRHAFDWGRLLVTPIEAQAALEAEEQRR